MKLKSYPAIGVTRKIRRFALFPTVMTNYDRIWLERYEIVEIRKSLNDFFPDDPTFGYWRTQSRRRLKAT
jgi:hypothetical protein